MSSLNMITFYSYDANIYAAELIITTDNVIAGSTPAYSNTPIMIVSSIHQLGKYQEYYNLMPQLLPLYYINCISILIITLILIVRIISVNILPYNTLLLFANNLIAV